MAMPPRNNRKEVSSPPSPKRNPHIPFRSSSSSSSSAADNFSSDRRMKPIVFPPGFKFVPTDEDLIFHYLKPFVRNSKIPPPNVPIHLVNIYESNPERLSEEYEKGNDKEWFFITERTKLQEGGKNQKRSDDGGTWKAIITKKIKAGQVVVGYKTALEYHIGKIPNALKSNWLMHEFWVEPSSHDKSDCDVDHALCKIYLTPKAYKRKAEEEENEKMKMKIKEDVVEALEEEVDQPRNVAFQEPYQPQQPRNVAFQQQMKMKIKEEVAEALEEEVEQPRNVAFQQPYQPQQFQQPYQPQPCPFISDEMYQLFNSNQIPDDFDAFWTGSIDPQPLDGDRESGNSGYLKKSSEKD
ncbi:unnamed protein product [Thlaspi arvense]|uniref:NAC domain-containing protein n=1 Tax=Thlaspi arvense TaxID=13288 RepID=A0AAU9SF31_THLAR|nr:unnamed protein product [Thlaspi arvense]